MFFRDLKPKAGVTLEVTLVEAHLPVRLGHRDATRVFAAPLSHQLAAAGLGTLIECTVRERAPSEVVGVTLYLGLTDASRSALQTVARMLEFLHAPCGSSIRLSDATGDPVIFGLTEGLELSIETDVAPDANARRDVAMTCAEAMRDLAVSRGWARHADRTFFYFYGESFQDMQRHLARILEEHPRFRGAAVRRMA